MISEVEKLDEIEIADMQLLRAILRLFAVPKTLEQIEQEFIGHSERLSRIEKAQCLQENGIRELEALHRKQSQALDAFYQGQNCMEEASRQQTLLSEQHYDRHIIEPLARRIFPLIDLLSENISRCPGGSSSSDTFEAVKAELIDLLANYGVEPVEVVSGSAFDAKIMQPVSFTDTDKLKKNMTIKAVVRLGFRRDERIVRPVMVDVYRFEKSE